MISLLRVLLYALGGLIVSLGVVWVLLYLAIGADARDVDGRYANSPLHDWFEHLRSGKGPCCADADGNVLKDSDWRSKDGHYQVFIAEQWRDVPDDAVVLDPNLFGRTMVWPYYVNGEPFIRCFMPGSMT